VLHGSSRPTFQFLVVFQALSPEKLRRADWLLQNSADDFLLNGMFSLPSSATANDLFKQQVERIELAEEIRAQLPTERKRRRLLGKQSQPNYPSIIDLEAGAEVVVVEDEDSLLLKEFDIVLQGAYPPPDSMTDQELQQVCDDMWDTMSWDGL
jgi:hypothetical protein